MILFISETGASLPVIHRMIKEGYDDVHIYIHSKRYNMNYDGMIKKVDISSLRRFANDADTIIFDSTVIREGTTRDSDFLKIFNNSDIDMIFNAMINEIPEGKTVIGATPESGSYNTNGELKNSLINMLGLKKNNKDVSGIDITMEMWFDGERPALYTYCLENRRWLTGNLGLDMKSQTNCMWRKKEEEIPAAIFAPLIPVLKKWKYVGPVSVMLTVDSRTKKLHCRDMEIGFRFDSLYCLLSLIKSGCITDFFTSKFSVDTAEGYGCSERITVPPYPYTDEDMTMLLTADINIDGMIREPMFWGLDMKFDKESHIASGAGSILGVMVSAARDIKSGFGKIYRSLKDMSTGTTQYIPMQFRIDSTKECEKKMKKLEEWGAI